MYFCYWAHMHKPSPVHTVVATFSNNYYFAFELKVHALSSKSLYALGMALDAYNAY